MVNRVAKGKRAEREFEKYCQMLGYETWKPAWQRYGSKDIFNLADIIAIDKETVLFIQVKTNMSDFYKARKQAKEFMKNRNINDLFVVVACKIKGKVWRVWVYNKEEEDKVIDFDKTAEKMSCLRKHESNENS